METSFIKNHSGSEFINYDIKKDVPKNVIELNPDVVIGSPPCQGFSDARGTRYRLDEKNDLVFHYYNWIDKIKPKIAIMENVKGMTTIGNAWKSLGSSQRETNIDFMELLRQKADSIGYKFVYEILNSKFYGTPQERERVFCYMVKKELNSRLAFPKKTHVPDETVKRKKLDLFLNENKIDSVEEQNPTTTIREAIESLPEPNKYENSRTLDIISPQKYSKKNRNTWYQKIIFDSNQITNHIARYPKNQEELEIMKRIPEGLTCDRKGKKHISVWELFQDDLTEPECKLLKELNSLRTKKDIKTKPGRYSEGYDYTHIFYEGFKDIKKDT